METTAKYREQYKRVKRWLARLETLEKGRTHDVPSENYIDEIYAFFMNCHHLKDWIKHDSQVAEGIREAVEGHISSSRPLRLCADICNSLKHLSLTSHRSSEAPVFGKKEYALKLGAGPATISLKYHIETTCGSVEAFQLATACVKAWDDFLQQNGLLDNAESVNGHGPEPVSGT